MTDQPSGMTVQKADTAVVFIDPQNDVLSDHGAAWDAVGTSVVENKTRENMERIFKSAEDNGYDVFISPHYFYPTDTHWKFDGPLEADVQASCLCAERPADPGGVRQLGRGLG